MECLRSAALVIPTAVFAERSGANTQRRNLARVVAPLGCAPRIKVKVQRNWANKIAERKVFQYALDSSVPFPPICCRAARLANRQKLQSE
jgi:hypothetical protein